MSEWVKAKDGCFYLKGLKNGVVSIRNNQSYSLGFLKSGETIFECESFRRGHNDEVKKTLIKEASRIGIY